MFIIVYKTKGQTATHHSILAT